MPQTARQSAKTTLNVTSGLTMLRRDMSTGAIALCTLIAERPLTMNVSMREHMNAHHNHHSFSNLLVKKMNQDQDQGRNATVYLAVTLPILVRNVAFILCVTNIGIADECDDGTTTNDPSCSDEFYPGWLCNEEENLIGEIEGISDPSDCQAICQNHDDCEFFNYYVEGHDKGFCQLHSSCSNFVEHEWCREHEGEHQCFAGPKYPDLDDCSYPELF